MISVNRAGIGTVELSELSAEARADWEFAYSGYQIVRQVSGYFGNTAAAATYVLSEGAFAASAANLSGPSIFRFDPAWYAAGSRTVKLRLLTELFVNNVSPGASRTLQQGLFPATNTASANVAATAGTVVTGSNPAAQTIAASTTYALDSGDFTAPAAGVYATGLILAGGAIAASSFVTVGQTLLVRRV